MVFPVRLFYVQQRASCDAHVGEGLEPLDDVNEGSNPSPQP